MQIIESTPFGVRSSILRLEADDDAPRFCLYPMIHVAEAEFYAEIAHRLESSDVILWEGVGSKTASLLTASYRYFEDTERLGLVSQQTLQLDHLKNRLVHADVSGQQFEKKWSELPHKLRYGLLLVAPIFGLYMRYFGTRSLIARYLNLNLRKARREILVDVDEEKFAETVLGFRDRHLVKVIDEHRSKPENSGASIAVLYGASHMRAVIRHLIDNGAYRVISAEWLTAISLQR